MDEDPDGIFLGLVYEDDATGELVRKPFLGLDGGPSGTGMIAFGPVVEPWDDDVQLFVDGCAHISSGIDAVLTAHGEPAGGSYSWGATPSSGEVASPFGHVSAAIPRRRCVS